MTSKQQPEQNVVPFPKRETPLAEGGEPQLPEGYATALKTDKWPTEPTASEDDFIDDLLSGKVAATHTHEEFVERLAEDKSKVD